VHLSRREGSRERGLQRSERARSKPGASESRPSPSQNVGINKAVYVGTTLPCESHTTPHAHALLAAAGPTTWRATGSPRQGVGDDVVPTSLNEGRGEVVMKALVVAFYLGQKHCPVDRWAGGGPVVAEGKAGSPNAERWKCAILGKDNFPCATPKAIALSCRGQAVLEKQGGMCI